MPVLLKLDWVNKSNNVCLVRQCVNLRPLLYNLIHILVLLEPLVRHRDGRNGSISRVYKCLEINTFPTNAIIYMKP